MNSNSDSIISVLRIYTVILVQLKQFPYKFPATCFGLLERCIGIWHDSIQDLKTAKVSKHKALALEEWRRLGRELGLREGHKVSTLRKVPSELSPSENPWLLWRLDQLGAAGSRKISV